MASAPKRVGFVSTRIAGTDGVSLEIEKWAAVLARQGLDCFYFAGELDGPDKACYCAPLAHFEHPQIAELNRELFGRERRSRALTDRLYALKEQLKSELYAFAERFGIELLIPENALTIPMNLPLGVALTEFIAETGLPTIAHHHDFYWERERFLRNACQDVLDQAFPPHLPSIRHVVINSLAAEQLSHRLGLASTIIPNVYDFAHEPEPTCDSCPLREEVNIPPEAPFFLQPTRVVPRKWIERSIEVVHQLKLAHPTLVISHAAGDEGEDYAQSLQDFAASLGVRLVQIDHLIDRPHGRRKRYTLADAYRCADVVLYPSLQEGFGNAFLEAIYFKKPIVVNRYPIFVRDIEPKQFEVIALDAGVTATALAQIRRVLEDEAYRSQMVEKNYALARRYFSFEVLEKRLLGLIESFET